MSTGKRGPKKGDVVAKTTVYQLVKHGILKESELDKALGLKEKHAEEFDALYLEMEAVHDAEAAEKTAAAKTAAAGDKKAAKAEAKAAGADKSKFDEAELARMMTKILKQMAAGAK